MTRSLSLNTLDGKHFYHAVMQGALHIIQHKIILNELNLFPVADSDTGNNLSTLMQFIRQQTLMIEDLSAFSQHLAQISLQGSKGNSGLIFAGFFSGFASSVADRAFITIGEFAECVQAAAAAAYAAVAEPVPGTLISIMADWGNACVAAASNSDNFTLLFANTFEIAQLALANTTTQLPILRGTDYVDAGAQAFVFFLEGMLEYWRTGSQTEISDEVTHAAEELSQHEHIDLHVPTEAPSHRYCTEALIYDLQLPLPELKKQCQVWGDSMVMVGTEKKARLHIHSNEPAKLFASLVTHAKIEQQKADDMLRQYQMAHARIAPIALVIDSTADLPLPLIDQHQMHVVPLQVVAAGVPYLDRITLSSQQFYEYYDRLPNDPPSSSLPSLALMESTLSSLQQYYAGVIVLTLPKKQSGTYQAFTQVAAKLATPTFPITVIDGCAHSSALGLLALWIAEQIQTGITYDALVQRLQTAPPKLGLWIAIDSFQALVRSGRVNALAGFLAKASGVRPIIALDDEGCGVVKGIAFSSKGRDRKLQYLLEEHHQQYPTSRYALVHTNAEARAEQLAELTEKVFKQKPLYCMHASPVIGVHAGTGGVAIATIS